MKNITTKVLSSLVLLLFILHYSVTQDVGGVKKVNYKVHTFYYGWFGNLEYDGKYNNWNHPILPHWRDTTWDNAGSFLGGDNIGANYYPTLGTYSSSDPEII